MHILDGTRAHGKMIFETSGQCIKLTCLDDNEPYTSVGNLYVSSEVVLL